MGFPGDKVASGSILVLDVHIVENMEGPWDRGLNPGWVSVNTGIVVIICRIILVSSKFAFQVLGVVWFELGVGEPKPGVLIITDQCNIK